MLGIPLVLFVISFYLLAFTHGDGEREMDGDDSFSSLAWL